MDAQARGVCSTCGSVFVFVPVCFFVSVTCPSGSIIQAVLNLHFLQPSQPARLMVSTDEYCIFTINPLRASKTVKKKRRNKCRVTERKRRRRLETRVKRAEGKANSEVQADQERRGCDWEALTACCDGEAGNKMPCRAESSGLTRPADRHVGIFTLLL